MRIRINLLALTIPLTFCLQVSAAEPVKHTQQAVGTGRTIAGAGAVSTNPAADPPILTADAPILTADAPIPTANVPTPAASAPTPTAGALPTLEGAVAPYPATTRAEAEGIAKRSVGRADPLAPIGAFKPFPSNAPAKVETKTTVTTTTVKESKSAIPAPGSHLVPPPPPLPSEDELPVSALPLPPDRPSIASKLKLTAIVGDKGFFTINDFEERRVNKWPKYLIMGPGDRFESIEMVSAGADSVVLREDGERCVKSLERIR